MTMTDTGVKPIPAYVPPEDGKPRNAVDEKWMKLTRSALPSSRYWVNNADLGGMSSYNDTNHRWV